MNRLVLIGNGFDLAHGMKTTYHDFILDYLGQAFTEMINNEKYEDQLIHAYCDKYYLNTRLTNTDFVNWSVSDFLKFSKQQTASTIDNFFPPLSYGSYRENLELKSPLIKILLQNCSEYNWVDIENEFYKLLCKHASQDEQEEIKQLNSDLRFITELLIRYLRKVEKDFIENIEGRFRITPFVDQISQRNYSVKSNSDDLLRDILEEKPINIVFLNFNYTSTLHDYLPKIKENFKVVDIINIHGDLQNDINPVIFGYGDEEETNFRLLETFDECLKFVKTYWYSRTENYQNLLNFIESAPFEVFVLGHSCGMSDKTLLSEIFNNSNCKHIRLLHYIKDYAKLGVIENTDYISKQYQVGRLFKDKGELRKKLVPFFPTDSIKINRILS